MNQLIERYIYDVTRRLPENDRAEVARELQASIMDMLPEESSEQQTIDVLTQLGDPRIMAEQYRTKPRYLISPALFDMYLSVLKMVVGIVAVVFAGVSAIITIFDTGTLSASTFFANIIEDALMGAFQAAFWVTFGFAVADHTNIIGKKAWTVLDLPKKPDHLKGVALPRSASIGEIITTLFFSVLFILMIIRDEWFFVFVRNGDIMNPFNMNALYRAIPFIIITSVISVAFSSVKLYYARWNAPLFIVNVIYNIIWVGIFIYIVNWPDLFNPDLKSAIIPHLNHTELAKQIIESDGQGIRLFLSVLMVFIALIGIVTAAVGTWRGSKSDVT